MSEHISFTVPLQAPSVNHYKGRSRNGHHFVTKEAVAFKNAVAICAQGARLRCDRYAVAYTVYLGKGSKGDSDNFSKCILDGLVEAGVIDTDAKVSPVICQKGRDWDNPRTEINVIGLGKGEYIVSLEQIIEALRMMPKEAV